MPNPDGTPMQPAVNQLPASSVQEFLTQQQNIVEQVEALAGVPDDNAPVRQVSPEDLAERMRQLGLNPDTTVSLGQVLDGATPPAVHVGPTPTRGPAQPVSPVFTETETEGRLEQMPEPSSQEEIDRMHAVRLVDELIRRNEAQQQETQTTDDMTGEYREFRTRQDERFPIPDRGEIVMTRAQLGRTRRPQIQTKTFRVISLGGEPPHAMWWAAFGMGQVEMKIDAQTFTYEEVMNLSTTMLDTFFYIKYDDGLEQTAPAAEAKAKPAETERRRKSNWVSILGSTLINMISLAPKNNMFRAKVMAVLKEPIPDEMDTAPKIKDWIEFEFPRDPQDVIASGLKFRTEYTVFETGTVEYSRVINGVYIGQLTRARIVEMVRANKDKDWDDLIVMFRDEIIRLTQAGGQETPNTPVLNNFEGTRTNFEATLMTSIRSQIREILRTDLTTAEIDDLGI